MVNLDLCDAVNGCRKRSVLDSAFKSDTVGRFHRLAVSKFHMWWVPLFPLQQRTILPCEVVLHKKEEKNPSNSKNKQHRLPPPGKNTNKQVQRETVTIPPPLKKKKNGHNNP